MNIRIRRRDPLAGTRPAFMPDPGEPVDPERRERDLRAIFDAPRPAGAQQPFLRGRLRLAVVVAGVVAAVVIAITPGANGPNAQASPREVLLAAADAMASTPAPEPGRYWHIRERSTGIETMWPGRNHGPYMVITESGSEKWDSRTGAEDTLSVYSIDVVTRALTPQDQVEWDKAGNPVGIPDASPAPGVPPLPSLPTSQPPSAHWRSGENSYNVAGKNRSTSEVLELPTDTEDLKAYLLEQFREEGPNGENPKDVNEWLTWEAEGLLSYVPTTPGTRAAAYRLLADLPGYRVLDAAELPDGSGVGLARTIRGGWSYTVENATVEHQMIIDPDTGSLRTERMVLLEPAGEVRRLPAGTVLYSNSIEHIGWVDTDPVVPPGAEELHTGGTP
jgi:hypothetical protein